jgi:dTDP-4-dehydrorhamnose 3,5-epimerase
MKLRPTSLREVVLVEPTLWRDERGWLYESFHELKFEAELARLGLPPAGRFVQDNHTLSRAGVVRGLHYQLPPHAQGRLVRVVRGAVYDVAVDLRPASPTFRQWVGTELTAGNRLQAWIPAGFAHGFLALEDSTEVLYKATDVHAPDCERAVRWDDHELHIDWPLGGRAAPLLSPRDAAAPSLGEADIYPAL